MREDSGLPFIGSIFQTFSCVANMASDIKNTFSNLLGGSIAVPDAIRIFGIQVAGIYDMVNFMAMPALNTDPSGPAPSEPHTNAPSDNAGVSTETPEFQPLLLHLHPRQQRLTLVHRHQHPISTLHLHRFQAPPRRHLLLALLPHPTHPVRNLRLPTIHTFPSSMLEILNVLDGSSAVRLVKSAWGTTWQVL
jgi:hypothetical protein